MKPVHVGVVGVGVWGEKHARVYDGLEEAVLVGLYDADGERARQVARRYGCREFATPEGLLRECEAVSIAVPTAAHRAAAEQAAAAGCHMMVEKPMAGSSEDAEAMLLAARGAGVQLQVGHVERFNPALISARAHVSEPKFIEAHRLALFQPRSLDIDVVFDLMIHDIDVVLEAVGSPPTRVAAVGVAVLSGNEDIANARLEFGDGCVANLTASRVSQDRLRRIRFFQQDTYLSIDFLERACEMLSVDRAGTPLARSRTPGADHGATMPTIGRKTLEVRPAEPLVLELRAFLQSLRGRGPGAATGEAGRAALRVAAEVRSAMKWRARQWAVRSSAVS